MKSKPKPTQKFKNCSHLCAYHCTQLSYNTAQNHSDYFAPNLQTIIISLTTGEGTHSPYFGKQHADKVSHIQKRFKIG